MIVPNLQSESSKHTSKLTDVYTIFNSSRQRFTPLLFFCSFFLFTLSFFYFLFSFVLVFWFLISSARNFCLLFCVIPVLMWNCDKFTLTNCAIVFHLLARHLQPHSFLFQKSIFTSFPEKKSATFFVIPTMNHVQIASLRYIRQNKTNQTAMVVIFLIYSHSTMSSTALRIVFKPKHANVQCKF